MKKILSLFGAAPTQKDYVDGADLFRVLCVLFVSWFHIWQQSWLSPNFSIFGYTVDIYAPVTCGYMFVDCLILLSGFLLMLSELNGRCRSTRRFFLSRVSRIVPSYYFFLLFQLILVILPGGLFRNLKEGLIDTLSHLTFTHNLFREGYIGSKYNGVLWTLAVEFQFYLLFPLIGRAFRKKPLLTWVIMTVIGFASRWFVSRFYSDTSLYFNRLPAMADVYANGMMAACIWVRLSKCRPSTLRAWLSTGLTILCCIALYKILRYQRKFSDYTLIRQNQMDSRFVLSAVASILLVASGRSIRLVRLLFSNKPVRFLAGISFNFYMWHQFIALFLKKWRIPPYAAVENPNMSSEQPWQLLYTLTCFAAAIAISTLLTYLLEKPCAKAIKKRFTLDKKS